MSSSGAKTEQQQSCSANLLPEICEHLLHLYSMNPNFHQYLSDAISPEKKVKANSHNWGDALQIRYHEGQNRIYICNFETEFTLKTF